MTNIPFISWIGHGAIDVAPPGVFTDATTQAFVIDASSAAMQSLTDKLLNPAGGGKVRYEVAAGLAMFSFMDVAKCESGTDKVGWLPGREAAVWVPLFEMHEGNPLKTRLVLWAPYIFINYAMGMVIGRETWGWAKVMGDISVPKDNPTNPVNAVATTYFPTLSNETQGVTAMLYQVTGGGKDAPKSLWASGEEALEAILGSALSGVAELVTKLFDFDPEVPAVALKQFRNAGDTNDACYQAIVNTPIEVTSFNGGGFLEGSYSLQVTSCESHQIVQDLLGRAPDPGSTTLPVKFAIWSKIDFRTLPGDNVVVA
jgi:hypothetical protein